MSKIKCQKNYSSTLIMNAGSSSIKAALYTKDEIVFEGSLSCIGLKESYFEIRSSNSIDKYSVSDLNLNDLVVFFLNKLIKCIDAEIIEKINLIGHRIKFGSYTRNAEVITDAMIEEIDREKFLSSGQNIICNEIIKYFKLIFPATVQIGVPDSSFFYDVSYSNYLTINSKLRQRYEIIPRGFHGLACLAMLEHLNEIDKSTNIANIIYCHIGSGVSVTAIKSSIPKHTTMLFSAADGLIMNNRSGNIQPGILLKLLNGGFPINKISTVLNYNTGIYGLADDENDSIPVSNYFLDSEDDRTSEYILKLSLSIIEAFVRLKKVDHIVFTGGVVKQSPTIIGVILRNIAQSFSLSLNKIPKEIKIDEQYWESDAKKLKVHHLSINEQKVIFNVVNSGNWKTSNSDKIKFTNAICVCPGVTVGILKVYTGKETLKQIKNSILLIDKLTPENVFKLKKTCALLALNGEPTSHGAAVCRELNIPCISMIESMERIKKFIGYKLIIDCALQELRYEKN